jgi:hypothetical protein
VPGQQGPAQKPSHRQAEPHDLDDPVVCAASHLRQSPASHRPHSLAPAPSHRRVQSHALIIPIYCRTPSDNGASHAHGRTHSQIKVPRPMLQAVRAAKTLSAQVRCRATGHTQSNTGLAFALPQASNGSATQRQEPIQEAAMLHTAVLITAVTQSSSSHCFLHAALHGALDHSAAQFMALQAPTQRRHAPHTHTHAHTTPISGRAPQSQAACAQSSPARPRG